MILEHYAAFRDHIRAVPSLTNRVYSDVRLNGDQPVRDNYVVLYPATPSTLHDDRYMIGQSVDSAAEYEFDVRAIAIDADGALMVADAVTGQVIGHRLIVAGRTCTRMRLVESSKRAQWDRKADLHYIDMTFQFRSQRET